MVETVTCLRLYLCCNGCCVGHDCFVKCLQNGCENDRLFVVDDVVAVDCLAVAEMVKMSLIC